MRIAMFTNNYKPYIGGVPISIEHLAKALRDNGHTVYVFAPSYENQVEEEYVIRYPSFPIKIAGAPIPNVLTNLFLQKVKELEIDVIHVHHPAIVGNVALMIKKKLGIPIVFTYHTRYEQYLHYVKPLENLERHTEVVEKYLMYFCNQCDLILAPTPGIAEYLNQKEIKTLVGVLPTGIREEGFFPEPEKVDLIRRQYQKDADYLFCTVSRLAEEKNLMFQLESLKILKEELRKQGKTFRYLMIGEGPQREELQRKIEELNLTKEILLIGNVANHEIKNYLSASSLFLFSSKSETQGIVILESMAAGTPVVAVEATGVRDVVWSGDNGFLTREDKKDWAMEIYKILEQPDLLREMEIGARRSALVYQEKKVAEKAELYYWNVSLIKQQTHPISFRKRFVL